MKKFDLSFPKKLRFYSVPFQKNVVFLEKLCFLDKLGFGPKKLCFWSSKKTTFFWKKSGACPKKLRFFGTERKGIENVVNLE